MTIGNETSASRPGMMGDGTEEQNLGQEGDPAARIGKDEVEASFAKDGKASAPDQGKAIDQVSNDMSDAEAAPEDSMPKDNSHNFT